MKHFFLTFLIFISLSNIFAQVNPDKFINNPLLKNANISLFVKDLNANKTLYEYRPTNSAVCASTMKLVSTATALEMYGPDFRFETSLEIDIEIKNSVLNGNLIIRGGGDPTLGSAKMGDKNFLAKWVEAVKKAGIKRINGQIIANTAIFEHQVINPGWIWEDMGNYYAPGIHGISYLDNTFRLVLRSGNAGLRTEIVRTEPEIGGLFILNFVNAANINSDNAYFYGEPYANNRSIYGEIPANRNEFVVKGDIPDPAFLLAQHLHAALNEAGIEITEFPSTDNQNKTSYKKIYSHFSVPLSEIITETNVSSNNHFAEYLFKFIGTRNNKVATNLSATGNIRAFWKQKGLSVDQLFQVDGSGLSPTNGVSANFFVELLSYMKTNSPYADVFYKSLAISGETGTLKSFLKKTALQGKVHGKSGTLARVKSYAGYIEKEKTVLAFAIIVNNPNGSSSEVVKKMEEFLLEVAK